VLKVQDAVLADLFSNVGRAFEAVCRRIAWSLQVVTRYQAVEDATQELVGVGDILKSARIKPWLDIFKPLVKACRSDFFAVVALPGNIPRQITDTGASAVGV